ARPVVGDPAFHLLEVAFPSSFLRLLAGPAQALVEEPADVVGVIPNTEMPLDQHGDPLTSPQVVGPTMSHSAFGEQGFQSGHLLIGQAHLTTQKGSGIQAAGLTSQASPTTKGGGSHAQNPSHDAGRLSTFE